MNRACFACAVFSILASHAAAETVVTPFDPQRPSSTLSHPVLAAAADGKVLMRLKGWYGEDRTRQWSAVFVLDSRGRTLRRIDLPDDGHSVVVPFRNGFVSQQGSGKSKCSQPGGDCIPERWDFVYHDLSRPGAKPLVLDTRQGSFHLVGTPDRMDLYLVSASFPYGMQDVDITRIDAAFKSTWTRTIRQLEVASLTATNDGISFTQYKQSSPVSYVLRAIGRDGNDRWEAQVPHRAPSDFSFLPAGYLVFPAGSRESPVWVNERTGEILPDIDLPNRDITVPTRDGLLVVGWMLGQSYAAMMKEDGNFAWMRRFKRSSDLQTFISGVEAGDGRLVLVAKGEDPSRYSLLSVDRDGKSLEQISSPCLTVPAQEAVALSERLRGRSVRVVAPNEQPGDPESDLPVAFRDGCPVITESQYMAFMDTLLAELPPAASGRPGVAGLAIRLLESTQPARLRSYSLYYGGGWSPRGAYAEFLVPHDRGREFGRFYTTTWQPHVRKLMALQDEFVRLTGFVYITRIGEVSDFDKVLKDLEVAAAKLNDTVRDMPAEQLRFVRERPPIGVVSIQLTTRGFGNGHTNDPYEERPLDQAADTLVHIVEEHRKAVARGEVMLE